MPIETYFRNVGGEVFGSSGQRPMLKNSFYGEFSFVGDVPPPPVPPTPSNAVCTINGGKIVNGVCRANWKNAKNICSASGRGLPSKKYFKQLVVDCGGLFVDWENAGKKYEYKYIYNLLDKNLRNNQYQTCYKQKGFRDKEYYWTSEYVKNYDNLDVDAIGMFYFEDGSNSLVREISDSFVLCVK